MTSSRHLSTITQYLAGEFENKQQAMSEPAWYVNLLMWQRPVSLFEEDSIAFFAEQANILNIEQAYRQRIIRITPSSADGEFKVQYYMFKDPTAWCGAGRNHKLLDDITTEKIDILPGCVLTVNTEILSSRPIQIYCKTDTR